MTDERRSRSDSPALEGPDAPIDPTRRQFFQAVGRQTAAGAGTAIRSVDALRRGGSAAAGELFGLGTRPPDATAARFEQGPAASSGADGFSSPYRFASDSLVVLDRRLYPDQQSTIVLREPSEVASAIRAAVVSGPVLAEVAAYAILLAAMEAWPRGGTARQSAVGAAVNTLRGAAGPAQPVRWAADRMAGVAEADDLDALHAAADAIASRAATDHARLGREAARSLPETPERDRELLLHGDMGPLSCGLVGTGFAAVQALVAESRGVHVWLTDGGPDREGTRITAPQLAQLDVPHTVVPDAAGGWLFANRHVDAVLLRGDWVRANGDTATPLGGLGLSQLARAAGVPVFVCTTQPAYDATEAPANHLRDALPAFDRARLEPATDVVPATMISSFLTEHGPLGPPYPRSLAEAFAPSTSLQGAG